MAYMVRLGIWGPGSPFRDFNDFLAAVEKRGVGAMEIVAMDMKLRGMYIARQLSFQVYHTSLHLFTLVFLVITSHLFLIISLAMLPLLAFETFHIISQFIFRRPI
jgi:hypothetical protein